MPADAMPSWSSDKSEVPSPDWCQPKPSRVVEVPSRDGYQTMPCQAGKVSRLSLSAGHRYWALQRAWTWRRWDGETIFIFPRWIGGIFPSPILLPSCPGNPRSPAGLHWQPRRPHSGLPPGNPHLLPAGTGAPCHAGLYRGRVNLTWLLQGERRQSFKNTRTQQPWWNWNSITA